SGLQEAAGGYRTTRLVRPDDPSAIARALVDLVDNWPAVIEDLPASRAEALRRHAPEVYRQTIARACGAETEPHYLASDHASGQSHRPRPRASSYSGPRSPRRTWEWLCSPAGPAICCGGSTPMPSSSSRTTARGPRRSLGAGHGPC